MFTGPGTQITEDCNRNVLKKSVGSFLQRHLHSSTFKREVSWGHPGLHATMYQGNKAQEEARHKKSDFVTLDQTVGKEEAEESKQPLPR